MASGAVRGLGLPWVHSGIVCSNCQESPIEGIRYKCESCREHNLCAKCYRQGHPHTGHRFAQIAVDSSQFHSPFQLYYIMCHDCGRAPIEGRCHQHKWRPNLHLCDGCHSRRPKSGNPSTEWKILDEPQIATICRTHSPVYHFHKRCGSCGISPIEGPRFDALSYPQYSLCLICFDAKFVKGLVENANFLRIEKPEPNKVRHVFMYACRNCGEVPIDGPAYINKRVQDKVLCLLCFMNIQPQAQVDYSRVDAPAQYGEPPPPSLHQEGSETVRREEYSILAEEFKRFKDEKEAASRVVASNLLSRAREVEQLRSDLQEAQRAAADHSNVDREEEVTRVRANYASLVQSFEKLKIEKDEALRASADLSDLTTEIAGLRIDKEEALRMSEGYAQQLKKEQEEAARVNSDYLLLAQKLDKWNENEEERTSNLEHSDLLEDHQKLKKELEETVEKCGIITLENEKLKAEKEDAAEIASLAKELERLDEGEEEMVIKSAAERNVLLQEIEKLTTSREELTQLLETVKEQAEAAKLSAEQKYVTLTEEFEKFREEKEQVVGEASAEYSRLEKEMATKSEEHLKLTRDLESHRRENAELEQSLSEAHDDLVQKYEKLLEDKAWLVQQVEDVYREKEAAEADRAAREDDLIGELKRLKDELDTRVRQQNEEQDNLTQECRKLTSEKESMAVLHASLVRRFETLEKEKEKALDLSIAHCSELAAEVERLKNEREEVKRLGSAEYSDLMEEVERLKMEKDEGLKTSVKDYTGLMEEFNRFKGQSEEAARDMDGHHSTLKIQYEQLIAEKEELARGLSAAIEKMELEKQERTTSAGALAEECEKLRGEKEAAAALSLSLSQELEKLEAESTANYSSLAEEFETYRKEREEIVITNTPDYKRLLAEYDHDKKEFLQIYEDLEASEDKNAELERDITEQHLQLTQELENLKAENAEEKTRLSEELEKCKLLPSFDMSGYGKCAQVAVCTYGAFVLRKKIALEEGYAKSRLSRADSETLREAEKLIAETAKDLDDTFEAFRYEAQATTDAEAREYYLSTALPAEKIKTKPKSGSLTLNDISSELAAVRNRVGR